MSSPSPGLAARHALVAAQLDQLIELAADRRLHDVGAARVSKWTVGKQLEHLLLSGSSVLDVLEKLTDGRRSPATGGTTLLGRIILATGFIPRGKGEAPEFATPTGRDAADLEAGLRRLAQRLADLAEQLRPLEESGWRARHPYFGALDIGQWMRFMEVHHRHHLKIVGDIRRAAGA